MEKRKPLFFTKSATKIDTNYAPNYKSVKTRIDNLCIPFNKNAGRKPPALQRLGIHRPAITTDGETYASLIEKKKKIWKDKDPWDVHVALNIKRKLPRNMNESSSLPCFMQKKNGSRFALDTFGEKAFEKNNYRDRDFFDNYDSFKKKRKFKIKKKKLDYDEDIDQLLSL